MAKTKGWPFETAPSTRAVAVNGGANDTTLWMVPTSLLAFACATSIPIEEKLGAIVTVVQEGQLTAPKADPAGPFTCQRPAFSELSSVKLSESPVLSGAAEGPRMEVAPAGRLTTAEATSTRRSRTPAARPGDDLRIAFTRGWMVVCVSAPSPVVRVIRGL